MAKIIGFECFTQLKWFNFAPVTCFVKVNLVMGAVGFNLANK